MKKFAIAIAILLVGAGALFLRWKRPAANAPPVAVKSNSAVPVPITLATVPAGAVRPRPEPPPPEITVLPIAEESLNLHRADRTAEDDLQLVEALLDGFRRATGSMPSGENAEIVAALRGTNQSAIAVLPQDHHAVRGDGNLVDRWGTPFFFHPISSTRMEILSAGPDRKLWTDDDVKL